ncbi:MAG: hypothetical protein ACOH2L_19205 [Devosia sp.]
MSRPLAITNRQAKTLIKAATEGNAIVEVETEIGIVRLIPAALMGSRNPFIGSSRGPFNAAYASPSKTVVRQNRL